MIKVAVIKSSQELEAFLNKIDIHSVVQILSGNAYTVIYEDDTKTEGSEG